MRVFKSLRRFHKDEQGDEGVNKILIIALIAVPLIIVLIAFGKDIKDWFEEKWTDVGGKQTEIEAQDGVGAI